MTQAFLENVSAANLTSDTIRKMYQLIDQGKTDTKFQELVYDVTKGTRNKDYRGEINKIFNWAKRTIRYTRDPYGVELVQDVWATIKRERGDCDDLSILLGAAVETMGAPVRITTVSTRADLEPVHVYPEAFVSGRWLPLDATVPSSYPGWKPTQGITDRKVWTRKDVGIHGYDEANVEGLGMGDPFFKQSVVPIDFGIPSDISHTYAGPLPGESVVSPRRTPGAPAYKIARYSDLTENPAPGDLPYNAPMPIRSFPMPEDIWSFRPRSSIPMKVDPWGHMKPWEKDSSAIFPKQNVPEDKYMSNVAGLGAISERQVNTAVSAVHKHVLKQVASGKVPREKAEEHATQMIDAVLSRPRGFRGGEMDMSMDWIPKEGGVAGLNLAGLGSSDADQVVKAIQTDVVNHVRTGKLHKDAAPAAAKKLVDAVQSGDKSVVNSAVAPATTHVVGQMKRRRGIRDSQGAYFFDNDESFEWLPAMYGLGETNAKQKYPELYRKIHALVAQRLPGQLRKHGLHPGRISGHGRPAGMHGLGEVTPQEAAAAGSLASSITGAIADAVDPGDATAINNAVNAGIQAAIQVVAPKPPAPATGGGLDFLKGWTVPLMVVGGIAAAAYFMKGKRGKYRSNPRRRSGGRRGSRGGGGQNKLLMWGLGAGAAYLIFVKPKAATAIPGAPAAPASIGQNLLTSIANLFKTPSAAPAVTGAVTSLTSGIARALAPSGTPSPSASQYASWEVAPGEGSPATADLSTMVTSLPDYSSNGSPSGMVVDFPE